MRRRVRQRPLVSTLGVLGLVVLVATFGGPLDVVTGGPSEDPARSPSEVRIVAVTDPEDPALWPFTSRRTRFDSLTLPINVVVRGNPNQLRWMLVGPPGEEWERTADWHGPPPARRVVGGESPWYGAHGATRYTYVAPGDGEGRWVDETDQLAVGSYFGTRYHLRMYAVTESDRSWTAIQVHHEMWDWFRLRHVVGSTARGRRHLEQQFFGRPTVSDVSRERYANGGIADADGWVSVVDLREPDRAVVLLPALLVSLSVLVAHTRRLLLFVDGVLPGVRESRRSLGLFAGVALVPVAVRHGSIAVAAHAPWIPPKAIAAAGYPVLAAGLPLLVFRVSRGLPAERGFLTAGVALGAGLFPDYAFLGIDALPVGLVLHRLALMVALGLVAAGTGPPRFDEDGEPRRERYLYAGAVLWVGALVWPLVFGY